MSFQHNYRAKRRSDAPDHQHHRDGGGGKCAGVAVHLKRKRLSFPSSEWGHSGDRYVCSGVASGRVAGDCGLLGYGNWVVPGLAMPVNGLPQRGCDASSRPNCAEQVKLAEDEDPVFMSRDQIERCSPSRKDGIDAGRETRLRYSYCSFLQTLGSRLELPQTTVGTAMVLCHRFFVRRSHACHDRYLIATAALFLASKSEETPRSLNNVLTASCEICQKHNLSFLPQFLPIDWFEQYRERIIEAENMILTTLNFELNVQHPYTPLTSVLKKLGLSQTALINLAWNLVSEGNVPISAHLGDIIAWGMICCACKAFVLTPEVEKLVCSGNTFKYLKPSSTVWFLLRDNDC